MKYPSKKFKCEYFNELELSIGKYDTEEDEPSQYYIGIFDNDDYCIQYDSLSYEHVLSVYSVVEKFTDRNSFTNYFHEYCKSAYLVDQMED